LNAHDADSELSQLAKLSDEEILLKCSPLVRPCYEAAFKLERETGGAFSPRWRGAGTLDLGAIAKGYAVDLAVEKLREKFPNGPEMLVDLGGNLKLLPDLPPGKKCYTVGIRNPAKRDELLAEKLELPGGTAVASSGDYERFTIWSGKRYGHIIDPASGVPGALPAVTVVCKSALDADIFSTSCYLGGGEAAGKLKKLYPDLQVYFFSAER
jgi:thiamine biosynthesis lipoprotein